MPSRSPWFSTHTHTRYSSKDATESVYKTVQKAKRLGYPGLVITDHGNMAASVQLYLECKKVGIKPYPGFEGYLIDPAWDGDDEFDGKAKRFHFGLFAIDEEGYKALVRFNSLSHTRPRFNRFPRHTFSDLLDFGAAHGEHVVLTTGCFFGLVQQRLITMGPAAAERTIAEYAAYFPNLIVELQHHNTDHDMPMEHLRASWHPSQGPMPVWTDDLIVEELERIADKLGLPIMAGQDSHYLDQGEKEAHDLLKTMFNIPEFPGDSYHLASAEWVQDHYKPSTWAKIEQTAEWLLDIHDVTITPLDNYEARLPDIFADPDMALRAMVEQWFAVYTAGMSTAKVKAYRARVEEELAVIRDVGQAAYFMIVDEFVRWCRSKQICVEARGSANGSMVAFALNITQVDPIKWGTLFERFMSRDRQKPPDIDIDIEDARREEALAWLEQRWGSIRIGTWAALGSRADNPDRGSALVSYIQYLHRCCDDEAVEMIEQHNSAIEYGVMAGVKMNKGAKTELSKQIYQLNFGDIKGLDDVARIAPEDYGALRQLIRMGSDDQHPSGVTRSYGTHAGGILLPGSDLDFRDYIPTMLVASAEDRVGGGIVTQYDMDDVDALGWQKLDILGQASLTVLQNVQRLMGRQNPDDFTWIPLDKSDPEACKILREGRKDNGIFHFEGYTKAKGGQELGIRSIQDTILAGALYMPGATDSGEKDRYIARRRDQRLRNQVVYYSDIYRYWLEETYGTVIYQEQPLAILRDYGMDMADINVMFKVLKDSGKGAVERNAARLQPIKERFRALATDIDPDDFEDAWHQIVGFAAYGFNRAHATGYGIRSYRFAYLKAHYPLEFMAGLLMSAAGDADDERKYAAETRRIGLRTLPPDVNISGVSWTMDRGRNGVRKGLLSVKGVGPACAAEIVAKAPFASLHDMAARVTPRAVSGAADFLKTGTLTGRFKDLDDAEALDSLKPEYQ